MEHLVSTAGRLVRPAVACVLSLLLLLASVPVHAAGTGGIEVTPVPSIVDGKPVTAFYVKVPSSGTQRAPFTLSNVDEEERSARLYVAEVTRSEGNFVLGDPGSSAFVRMEPRTVTLAPGEVREETFTVVGGDVPDREVLAAVVVEVQRGAVLQRASTLIYLETGRQVPLPLLIVLVAVALLAAAGTAFVLVTRRRRATSPVTANPTGTDQPADAAPRGPSSRAAFRSRRRR